MSEVLDMTSDLSGTETTDMSVAPVELPSSPVQRIVRAARAAASSVVGFVSGVAPHVLHHVGPLAGAAIVTGAAGTAVFGLIGLAASRPFLWRLHRRSGGWRTPGIAFLLFTLMFALSSLVIGPAISGDRGQPPPVVDQHTSHHPSGG